MEQSTLAEICECGQLNKKGKLIECKQDPSTMDHEGKRCTRIKRGKGELRCAKCSGQSKKPARGKEKYLDDFDRTRAIGFANNFVVSLPEDTRQHLERRSSLMWREALNKVPDWDKLPRGMVLENLRNSYTVENQAFLINDNLVAEKSGKVLSSLRGWQPWHLDQPLNQPLTEPAQHLAIVAYLGPWVSNADGTPRIVFSANLALKDVASYDPDVQLNPVNSPIHWGFLDFAAKEFVKYFLAGTDLAPTVDDENVKVLNTLGADVMKCLDKVTNKRRREAEGSRKRGRR
ncbi:hypothetical protein CYMTET_39161 [Cymbomonas tetramitiformis]|uniref:Uncharacterized protein n=1 Tax=Cymbomonas tetramitiformis TaxID=36881 RepID=A0AAE0CAK5_9CHLO|nr:hypothetical protein CYMTET_39161 [Cymbomonas tetramitiformis]